MLDRYGAAERDVLVLWGAYILRVEDTTTRQWAAKRERERWKVRVHMAEIKLLQFMYSG